MTVNSVQDYRLELASKWLAAQWPNAREDLVPVAGDASFRRYFRARDDAKSLILMDAPPDREDSQPFVDICARLRRGGVHAPDIIAADLEQGFLLLEDFGDQLFRDVLHSNNADQWFPHFFDVLELMAANTDAEGLPDYDRNRLLTELELFPAWYLEKHRGIRLSCDDWDVWEALCTRLITTANEQPRVFVHRDFHSCNLLLMDENQIGVIDFQDGVRGPITYDFASLAWDRYLHWPRSRLEAWMEEFRQRVAAHTAPDTWQRWCDWMGLQRNLKIVGIFARLNYRDGKAGYLEMIPQFWGYLQDVLPLYPEFDDFRGLLEKLQCAP